MGSAQGRGRDITTCATSADDDCLFPTCNRVPFRLIAAFFQEVEEEFQRPASTQALVALLETATRDLQELRTMIITVSHSVTMMSQFT